MKTIIFVTVLAVAVAPILYFFYLVCKDLNDIYKEEK